MEFTYFMSKGVLNLGCPSFFLVRDLFQGFRTSREGMLGMVNSSKTVGKSSCRRSVLRQLNIPSVGILDTWAFPYLSCKTNLNKISITLGY